MFFLVQADNAGFDATDLLNRLRQMHARDGEAGKWFGVDVDTEGEWRPCPVSVPLLSRDANATSCLSCDAARAI